MIEIRFSSEALSDLQQAQNYITEELCSESAAIHTISVIVKRIRTLSEFPEAGASLSAIVGFDTGYRYLVCGNYNVFYLYEHHTVHIMRVLYSRRDFMRILFDTE
ncbi:MAG: type II toxin-antitoxin system RelE/ParE family toxin [Clostridia bacterium]|nr:type II toxin-antitoxin system RelE/ParE family toxin [Clostridia bacterium]